MRRQGGTFQNVGPTTVRLTNISNKITGVTPITPTNYNDIITPDQLNLLKSLRYIDGRYIINPEMQIGKELLYEVLYRVSKGVPFDLIFQFFQSDRWNNEDDIYFNLPEFNASKYQYIKYIESYHDEKEITEGIYTCPKCQSKETIGMSKQTRSSDEPETVKVVCTNCQHGWRVG